MKWNDSLSIGHEKIDNQHKKLIKTLDDHLLACREKRGRQEIINTLNFLAKYVVIHFRDEEKYMKEIEFPKFTQHKAIHDEFIKEVTGIIKKVNNDGVSLSVIVEVNTKLNNWVFNHIMKMDKEYARFAGSL